MELNNMTGDPNQKSPSVFRFDAYPGSSGMLQWNTNDQKSKYPNLLHNTNNAPIFTNNIPSQIPTSFSFGSPPSTSFDSQFAYQITNHGYGEKTFKHLLGKRKTNSPPLRPFKQHITEEKMAEHMSKLHISSETATSPLEPESVKHKRLYMCEEMRKLQYEPIIPPSLVSGIERPCTALVLWQPPIRVLPVLGDESNGTNENKEDLNRNNIGEVKCVESIDMLGEYSNNMDMDA